MWGGTQNVKEARLKSLEDLSACRQFNEGRLEQDGGGTKLANALQGSTQ